MSKEAAAAAVSTECDFANGAAELLRTEPERPNMSKEAAAAAVARSATLRMARLSCCGRIARVLLRINPVVDMSTAGCYI